MTYGLLDRWSQGPDFSGISDPQCVLL